jgi:hypothetical protein
MLLQTRYQSLKDHWILAIVFYTTFVALPQVLYFFWIFRSFYSSEVVSTEDLAVASSDVAE